MASTYIQQHRQKIVAGTEAFKVLDPSAKYQLNEQNALYHANILKKNFGFNNEEIGQLLERMRMMEELGLNQLTTITENQNDYFKNNKDDINKNFFA
jgi:Leucine-rich repeat (LRR) protein